VKLRKATGRGLCHRATTGALGSQINQGEPAALGQVALGPRQEIGVIQGVPTVCRLANALGRAPGVKRLTTTTDLGLAQSLKSATAKIKVAYSVRLLPLLPLLLLLLLLPEIG
jgi:hypothetical protein